MSSWLKSDESGIGDVLSIAEVVSLGGISIGSVESSHYFSVVPDVVLGDSLSEGADVQEDLSLISEDVQVLLQMLAIAENIGGLTVDLTEELNGLKEAGEGQRFKIGDHVLDIGDKDICVLSAGLDLCQVVLLHHSRHEAGKGSKDVTCGKVSKSSCANSGNNEESEELFEHIDWLSDLFNIIIRITSLIF